MSLVNKTAEYYFSRMCRVGPQSCDWAHTRFTAENTINLAFMYFHNVGKTAEKTHRLYNLKRHYNETTIELGGE